MSRAPVRLLEQGPLSDTERSLLEAGRAGAPVEYDPVAGAARFRAHLATLAAAAAAATVHRAASGASAAGGKALWGGLGAKLLLGFAVVATLGGGGIVTGLLVARRSAPAGASRAAPAALEVSAPNAPAPLAPPAMEANGAPVSPGAPVLAVPTASSYADRGTGQPFAAAIGRRAGSLSGARISVPKVQVVSAGDGSLGSRAESATANATGVSGMAEAAIEGARTQPSAAPSAAEARPALPQARDSEPSRPAASPDSLRELRAIAVARSLMERDPQAALGVLEKLGHDYPRGYFVEERQALTVIALAGIGHYAAARQQAATFLHVFPNGPFSDRVRAVRDAAN